MADTNNSINLEGNTESPKFRSYLSPENRTIILRSDSPFYQYEIRMVDDSDSLVQKFQGHSDLKYHLLRNKDKFGYICQDQILESEIQTIIASSLKTNSSPKYTKQPTQITSLKRGSSPVKKRSTWGRKPLSA